MATTTAINNTSSKSPRSGVYDFFISEYLLIYIVYCVFVSIWHAVDLDYFAPTCGDIDGCAASFPSLFGSPSGVFLGNGFNASVSPASLETRIVASIVPIAIRLGFVTCLFQEGSASSEAGTHSVGM